MKDETLDSFMRYITECYQKQHYLYEQLMLSTMQIAKITVAQDETIGSINEALNEREKIIQEISRIDRDVKSKRQKAAVKLHLIDVNTAKLSGLVEASLIAEFVSVRTAIDDLIKKIITMDNQNQEVLKNKMKNVAAELKKFQVHHDIKHVYLEQPGSLTEPRFFDKRE